MKGGLPSLSEQLDVGAVRYEPRHRGHLAVAARLMERSPVPALCVGPIHLRACGQRALHPGLVTALRRDAEAHRESIAIRNG